MAKQTSYAHQIQLLIDLKSYLNNLQDRLNHVSMQYWSKSNDISQAGMFEETYSKFVQEYVYDTNQKIKDVVRQINERDIPFIEQQIAYLESRPS